MCTASQECRTYGCYRRVYRRTKLTSILEEAYTVLGVCFGLDLSWNSYMSRFYDQDYMDRRRRSLGL